MVTEDDCRRAELTVTGLNHGGALTIGNVVVDRDGTTVVSTTTTVVVNNQRGTLVLMVDRDATDMVNWLFTGGDVYERGFFGINEECPFEATGDVAMFLATVKAMNNFG